MRATRVVATFALCTACVLVVWFCGAPDTPSLSPAKADTDGGAGVFTFEVQTCVGANSSSSDPVTLTLRTQSGTTGTAWALPLDNPGTDRAAGQTDRYHFAWPSSLHPPSQLLDLRIHKQGSDYWCMSRAALRWNDDVLWQWKSTDTQPNVAYFWSHPITGPIGLDDDPIDAPAPFVRFANGNFAINNSVGEVRFDHWISARTCSGTTSPRSTDTIELEVQHDGLVDIVRVPASKLSTPGQLGVLSYNVDFAYIDEIQRLTIRKRGSDAWCFDQIQILQVVPDGAAIRWSSSSRVDLPPNGSTTFNPNIVLYGCGGGCTAKRQGFPFTLNATNAACASGSPPQSSTDTSCNTSDEDCDGMPDDNFSASTSCGIGVCQRTAPSSCVEGSVVAGTCVAGSPTNPNDTVCDNFDGDCDARTDEGYVRVTTSCGVGLCARTGLSSCVSGSVQQNCMPGAVTNPNDTTCDNQDGDCDSRIDEGFVRQTTSCGVGGCARNGQSSCVAGVVQSGCTPGTPVAEACDSVDNDCDGQNNEDLSQTITCGGGICANTVSQTCSGNAWTPACTPNASNARPEIPRNGLDDDCDGQVDDGVENNCTDGRDDDADGLFDCNDVTDCNADNACRSDAGQGCDQDYDCEKNLTCLDGICRRPHCDNGVKDENEFGRDCGGPCAPCNGRQCEDTCRVGEPTTPPAIATLRFANATFYRDSPATFESKQGLETARPDELRWVTIDGNRLALFEGASTNMLPQSEALVGPEWAAPESAPMVVTPNAAAAPNETMTAELLATPGDPARSRWTLGELVSNRATLSVWLRKADASFGGVAPVRPLVEHVDGLWLFVGGGNTPFVGTTYGTLASSTWFIGPTWERYEMPVLDAQDLGVRFSFSHVAGWPEPEVTALEAPDFHAWGVQLEDQPFPTSYIPAGETIASRAADTLLVDMANVPTWITTGMWQVDVAPLYASDEMRSDWTYTLFAFEANRSIALVKSGAGARLRIRQFGWAIYDSPELHWGRGTVLRFTFDVPGNKITIQGAEAGNGTYTPPALKVSTRTRLRVGGIPSGTSEAFAAINEPRVVVSPTRACALDASCTCGNGVLDAGEPCDPGLNYLCNAQCSELLDPDPSQSDADCPSGQVYVENGGANYGLSSALDLCIPEVCASNPALHCGTIDDTCGLCMPTPNCAGKTCGDDLDDGSGGLCPVQCGPRECGCESDAQCPSGYRCLVGRGPGFGCGANSNVCAPEICDDFSRDDSRCGEVTSECGLCPERPPLCAGLECGTDENGRPCPNTCEAGEVCIENQCVAPAQQEHSDPTVPDAPVLGAGATARVGAIPAVFDVDESGHAAYSIGIEAPAGFNGMHPKLSLQYKSGAGNGYVGLGWSVAGFGLSLIQRCAKNYAEDGTWSLPQFSERQGEEDALCLEGKRLRVVRDSADETEYRTVPDTFAKIIGHKNILYNGPVSLTVYAKDGTIHTYGGEEPGCPPPPSNGRDERCNNSQVYQHGVVPNVARRASIRTWALSSVRDRAGNELKVYYTNSGACSDPSQCGAEELRPGRINYSGGGWVRFDYFARARRDPVGGYRNGTPTRKTVLLKKVVTGSAAGGAYRSYWLKYHDDLGDPIPAHHPSTLSEVHLCASDGPGKESLACLPATAFSYKDTVHTGFSDPVTLSLGDDVHKRFLVLDHDGDGRDELLVVLTDLLQHRSEVRLYRNYGYTLSGEGHFENWIDAQAASDVPLYEGNGAGGFTRAVQAIVDLDSDQKDDLLVYEWGYPEETWRFLTWNGTRFVRHPSFPVDLHESPVVLDVDGNGEKDLLFCTSREQWSVQRQVGSSVTSVKRTFPAPRYDAGQEFGLVCPGARQRGVWPQPPIRDLDGDGLPDLLTDNDAYPGMIKIQYGQSSGTFTASFARYGHGTNRLFADSSVWGDFNGDGYPEPLGSINTGRSLEPASHWDQIDDPVLVVDYDADGRDDVLDVGVRYGAFFEGSFRKREQVEWDYEPPSTTFESLTGSTLGTADFGGDGVRDVVAVTHGPNWSDSIRIWEGKSFPRRLERVVDGLGNEVLIDYADNPARGLQVATAHYEALPCSAPCQAARAPRDVVWATTHKQGESTRDTYYTYKGMHRDAQRGTTIGFVSRTEEERRPQLNDSTGQHPARRWRRTQYEHGHSVGTSAAYTPGHGGGFFTASRPAAEVIVNVFDGSPLSGAASEAEGTVREWSRTLHNSSAGIPFAYSNEFRRYTLTGSSPTRVGLGQEFDDINFFEAWLEVSRVDTVDGYGNLTSSYSLWADGTETLQRASFIDPAQRPEPWQIGLKDRDWFSWGTVGAATQRAYRRASYEYDDRGFLFATTREPSVTTWDLNNQPASANSRMQLTRAIHELRTEHDVDQRGRIRAVSQIFGTEMRQTRVQFANNLLRVHPESSFDALGFETVVDFDRNSGQLLFTRFPDGRTKQNIYDALGRLKSVVEPEGTTAVTLGAATPLSVPVEGEEAIAVDASYARLVTSPDGQIEQTLFDSMSRPVRRRWRGPDGSFASIESAYDAYGNLIRETGPHETSSPALSSTSHLYDGLGRRRTTLAPASRRTDLHYASVANLSAEHAALIARMEQPTDARLMAMQVDPQGNVEYTVTGARGQVVANFEPDDVWTSFLYGPFDMRQFSLLHDASGTRAITETNHSPYGWLLSATDPSSGRSSYAYTHFGQVRTHTDANQRTATLHYDALGRTVDRQDADGLTEWTWDCLEREPSGECAASAPQEGFGKLLATSSSDGHELSFQYDPASKKVAFEEHRVSTPAGVELLNFAYDYNTTGQLEYMSYPVTPQGRLTVRYRYTAGHVSAVERVQQSGTTPLWKRGVEVTGVREAFEFGNGVISLKEHDRRSGDLKLLASWPASAATPIDAVASGAHNSRLLSRWDLLFDANRNLLDRRSLGDPFHIVSVHDAHDRLRAELRFPDNATGFLPIETYDYDSLGNLSQHSDVGTYAYEPGRPYVVASAGNTTFEHDNVGNQIHREGEGVAGQVQDITYTATNLVRSIAIGGEEQPSIRYEYNAQGERVLTLEPERTTLHVGRLYERIDEPSGQTHRQRIVVDGVPVAEIDERSGIESGRYFHMDWRRTPTLITNFDGGVVDAPRHDAFGIQWAGSPVGDVGFTAHRMRGAATGLIDMGARHYDPWLGRFLSADPLVYGGAASQGYNRYAYVLNNPHKYIDPTGLQADESEYGAHATVERTTSDWDWLWDWGSWFEPTYEGGGGCFGGAGASGCWDDDASDAEASRADSATSLVGGSAPGGIVLGDTGAALNEDVRHLLGEQTLECPLCALAAKGAAAIISEHEKGLDGGLKKQVSSGPNQGTGSAAGDFKLRVFTGGLLRAPALSNGSQAGAARGTSSVGAMARARYVASPKHGAAAYNTAKGIASRAPTNGQAALDTALELGNGTRRIGVDAASGEFVVFDQTNNIAARFPEFHGHVRAWGELTSQMQSLLIKEGYASRAGKILVP